jgi:hypothetical protein
MSFTLTKKQDEALDLILEKEVKHLLLYGGAQSAKTFFALYLILMRALKYANSVHAICRLKLVDLKSAILLTKFPEMVNARFPKEAYDKRFIRYVLSYPSFCELGNGSKIFFIGLDDKKGFEKVLSPSYSSFLIDEASEVPYGAYSKLLTRLSQNNESKKISLCTLNPTSKRHWTYQLFFEKISPVDKTPISSPQMFRYLQMNPKDNLENLPEDYIETLESLPESERQRFLFGQYDDNLEGAVYGQQLRVATESGQFVKGLKIDEEQPIYAIFDLGINDAMAVWIVQFLRDRILFINYYEAVGSSIIDVFKEFIFSLPYKISGVYLPHDAKHRWVGTGLTVKQILEKFALSLNESDRFWINVLPEMRLWQGINAARILFAKCYFDEMLCSQGISALRDYKYEYNEIMGVYKSVPIHNWASHGSDAFRYSIMAYNSRLKMTQEPQRDENYIYFNDLIYNSSKY